MRRLLRHPSLTVQTAEAEVFHLKKLIDAIMGSFAPKSGLLYSAERCRLGGDQTRVDADHSVFELIGNAPNPSDITPKKVTGETEFGIIRKLNRFLIFVEPEERSNGSECFVPTRV
jgi:hypothetical protein